MSVITIPKPLRDKLGDDATDAFVTVLKEIDSESKKELSTKEDISNLREATRKEIIEVRQEFAALRQEFAALRQEFAALRQEFTKLEGEIRLLKWMMGFILAGIISLVLKSFFM